jgi:hypothetical protein
MLRCAAEEPACAAARATFTVQPSRCTNAKGIILNLSSRSAAEGSASVFAFAFASNPLLFFRSVKIRSIRGSVFALSPNHPVHPNAPHLQSVSVHAPSAIAPQSVHEKLRNSASCPQISAKFGVLSSQNHYN